MRTWVLGATGVLGRAFAGALESRGELFVATTRCVDITDESCLRSWAKLQRPEIIINCAGYSRIDEAERDEEKARSVNAIGVGYLAKIAQEIDASLLHISTDQVFSGESLWHPYLEDDAPRALNVYGQTKLEGERFLAQSGAKAWVVRTSWLFGQGPNPVRMLLHRMRKEGDLNVPYDQRGRPTYAKDLAEACLDLVGLGSLPAAPLGTYHFANEGDVSWFELAVEILTVAEALGVRLSSKRIFPVETEELSKVAPRPPWSVLDTTKISKAIGREPRSHRLALVEYLSELVSKAGIQL